MPWCATATLYIQCSETPQRYISKHCAHTKLTITLMSTCQVNYIKRARNPWSEWTLYMTGGNIIVKQNKTKTTFLYWYICMASSTNELSCHTVWINSDTPRTAIVECQKYGMMYTPHLLMNSGWQSCVSNCSRYNQKPNSWLLFHLYYYLHYFCISQNFAFVNKPLMEIIKVSLNILIERLGITCFIRSFV